MGDVLPFLRRRAPGPAQTPEEHLRHSVQDAEALEKRGADVWRIEREIVLRGEELGDIDPAVATAGARFIKDCQERLKRLDELRATDLVTSQGPEFVARFDELRQSVSGWLEFVHLSRTHCASVCRRDAEPEHLPFAVPDAPAPRLLATTRAQAREAFAGGVRRLGLRASCSRRYTRCAQGRCA